MDPDQHDEDRRPQSLSSSRSMTVLPFLSLLVLPMRSPLTTGLTSSSSLLTPPPLSLLFSASRRATLARRSSSSS